MTKKKTVRISRDKVLSTKDLITEALIPEVKKKCFIHLGRKAVMNLDSVLKSRDITFTMNHKGPYSQSYGFSSSQVQM